MVERRLAKANVAGPNPVSRSKKWHHSQVVRQKSAKLLCPGPNPGGASKIKKHFVRSAFCVSYFDKSIINQTLDNYTI